ncbi:hypothetical protein WMY93_006875 [Mugilogobius chulae]|uniref:G8 domain-containing protein n=1 Tax=Mugilogobius chulae TaxID=88201 RepID=A0AAW0PL22_9GOBI
MTHSEALLSLTWYIHLCPFDSSLRAPEFPPLRKPVESPCVTLPEGFWTFCTHEDLPAVPRGSAAALCPSSEHHRVTIGRGQKVLLRASATVHSLEILSGGTKASSEAHVSRTFHPSKGLSFSVTASSQWVQARERERERERRERKRKKREKREGKRERKNGRKKERARRKKKRERKRERRAKKMRKNERESKREGKILREEQEGRKERKRKTERRREREKRREKERRERVKEREKRKREKTKRKRGKEERKKKRERLRKERERRKEREKESERARKKKERRARENEKKRERKRREREKERKKERENERVSGKERENNTVSHHGHNGEAEWTEWLSRDDQRGSGDWEKLSDLLKSFPQHLCPNPMDIQAETTEGVSSDQSGDIIHKMDKDYGFVCLNKDQPHGMCHDYRVRFLCRKLVRPQAYISIDSQSNSSVLELADPPQGWGPGDRIVVASTDYSMHQAEEFTVLPCPGCTANQIRVEGGEGFRAVHLSGVELQHMGQQTMGHYPIHFHMNGDVDEKGGYNPPTSINHVSIHHSFSRCVTIHGTNGLLVKDVVGYDTLGHCFFTEDGPEERNTFDHCLGLMVRAGTLLPSDRDSKMCRVITGDSFPGYVANPRQDCSATSTFWIANPNNNLVNCSAAGSEETGYWFIFHHLTPMGLFINNRAHSNYRAGMILDNGVKTSRASNKDKRPYLSLVASRYGPHQDADPFKPRVPALIHRFIAYKNMDQGAWLRGGDVWLDDCQFADNAISLTLASDNRGNLTAGNVNFPLRGMQVYDGPIQVHNCTFRKFSALDGRHTSAIGFRLNNSWQSCPNNNVSQLIFDQVPLSSRLFFGEVGPWFSRMQMDGDKTTVLHDTDGSLSQYPGAFLVKEDNWLLRHPDCIDVPEWRGAICSGRYAQIYVQIRNPASLVMQMVRDEYPDRPLTLEGAVGKKKHYQQFQPVVTLYKGYTVHWDQAAPQELIIWIINFNNLLFVRVLAHNHREGFSFCSLKGCERIKITAVIPKNSPPSNCMSQAYPRHTELPLVELPMPTNCLITKCTLLTNCLTLYFSSLPYSYKIHSSLKIYFMCKNNNNNNENCQTLATGLYTKLKMISSPSLMMIVMMIVIVMASKCPSSRASPPDSQLHQPAARQLDCPDDH